MRRPFADPTDGGQLSNYFLVGQLADVVEVERAGLNLLGERAQVGDLRIREADCGAQLLGVIGEDFGRGWRMAAEALEQPTPEDRYDVV